MPTHIMVDVESDGPIPGKYSMVSFGAIVVDQDLDKTFYGQTKPISDIWIPEALRVSGHTREEHESFPDPKDIMEEFADWISDQRDNKLFFWSDNNGYDFAFINWYFHQYYGKNPFGWSSRNLNDLYKGCERNSYASFKKLRKTKHTHHPVDDAKGNAEALLAISKIYKIKGLKL